MVNGTKLTNLRPKLIMKPVPMTWDVADLQTPITFTSNRAPSIRLNTIALGIVVH